MITIGECFSTDGAASAYAHNFGKGYMEFPPLTIGAGVHLSHLALVNPGLHVPDGTHVGPASSVSKLTQLDDSQCLTVQGNPPRRCQRTQSQHYVHEGSNVREWEDAARTIAKRTSPWRQQGGMAHLKRGLLSEQYSGVNAPGKDVASGAGDECSSPLGGADLERGLNGIDKVNYVALTGLSC